MKKDILVKRFKSFLWRTGMMVAVAFVAWIGETLGLFNLPLELTAILGLVLGEVSKFLNSNLRAVTTE